MKHTKVCEFHFRPEEIKVSSGCGKKTLKSGNEVPSIFSFKTPQDKLPRKSPCKKLKYPEYTTNIDTETHTIIDSTENVDCENFKLLSSEKTIIEKKKRSMS